MAWNSSAIAEWKPNWTDRRGSSRCRRWSSAGWAGCYHGWGREPSSILVRRSMRGRPSDRSGSRTGRTEGALQGAGGGVRPDGLGATTVGAASHHLSWSDAACAGGHPGVVRADSAGTHLFAPGVAQAGFGLGVPARGGRSGRGGAAERLASAIAGAIAGLPITSAAASGRTSARDTGQSGVAEGRAGPGQLAATGGGVPGGVGGGEFQRLSERSQRGLQERARGALPTTLRGGHGGQPSAGQLRFHGKRPRVAGIFRQGRPVGSRRFCAAGGYWGWRVAQRGGPFVSRRGEPTGAVPAGGE